MKTLISSCLLLLSSTAFAECNGAFCTGTPSAWDQMIKMAESQSRTDMNRAMTERIKQDNFYNSPVYRQLWGKKEGMSPPLSDSSSKFNLIEEYKRYNWGSR